MAVPDDLSHTLIINQGYLSGPWLAAFCHEPIRITHMTETIARGDALSPSLIHLLELFDVESLGEGDFVAGANVLAAMSISLANLHPPGTCLITPDRKRLPVGMSFAAVGGLTDALIGEKVVRPITQIQNNLSDHVAANEAHDAAKVAATPPPERLRIRPSPPQGETALRDLEVKINGLVAAADSSDFLRLLDPRPNKGIEEILLKPSVFLSAGSSAELKNQLTRVHRNHPYVRVVLTEGSDLKPMERLLYSLVRGTSFPGPVGAPVHIQGHVALSCSPGTLATSVTSGVEGLLDHLLWLSDGGPWQHHEMASARGAATAPYQTHLNYREALRKVFAERLDYRKRLEPSIQVDLESRQREWVAVLQKLEGSCPGITLAVRPLFATLVYGLILLSRGGEKFRWAVSNALELARMLVLGMAQRRLRLVQTQLDLRTIELAGKILLKLEGGPLTPRGIVRKTHGLLIGECREGLDFLERMGVARQGAREAWELSLPVSQAVERLRNPIIEV